MITVKRFAGQNWLITPAASPAPTAAPIGGASGGVTEPAASHIGVHAGTILDQVWLVVLSGVAEVDFKGNSGEHWLRDTLTILPDMAGPDSQGTSGPLSWAINQYHIPKPSTPPGSYYIGFSATQWAPFASLSSIFNQDQSVNSGFEVSKWRPALFGSGTDILSQQPVNNLFSGINVDLAVRDSDALIHGVGYHITLLGKIVFPAWYP